MTITMKPNPYEDDDRLVSDGGVYTSWDLARDIVQIIEENDVQPGTGFAPAYLRLRRNILDLLSECALIE